MINTFYKNYEKDEKLDDSSKALADRLIVSKKNFLENRIVIIKGKSGIVIINDKLSYYKGGVVLIGKKLIHFSTALV